MTARPYTLTLEPQSLADALTTLSPPAAIQDKDKSLKDFCREQGYQFSENHRAGEFSAGLPETVHRMTAGQISRSAHYQQRDEGYPLWFPYDHHRVIAIKRIAEPVFAKSILRGEGNTDAGDTVEDLANFGLCDYSTYTCGIDATMTQPNQGPFSFLSLLGIGTANAFVAPIPPGPMGGFGGAAAGGAIGQRGINPPDSNQDSRRFAFQSENDYAIAKGISKGFSTSGWFDSARVLFAMAPNFYEGDSLTQPDLLEIAEIGGTAPTRLRVGFASSVSAEVAIAMASAPQLIALHTERDSGLDQVPVIKGQLASHAETHEILSLPINQRNDGLPSAMSSLEVYRFDMGGGRVIYMVVTKSGEIANLSIRLDDLPEIPRLPPTERPEPKKMEAPEGISIPDIDPRPICFPIPDKDIRWVNEGTPIPEQRDLDDYILTVDRKDIKPAYVSLDTKRKGSLTETKTPIPPNANEIEKKSLERENQSAEILSENGYNVEQNPKIDSIKNPDYKINGEVFDNIAPTSPSVRNIYDRASQKVLSGQTSNVVINLEGSSALASDLEKQFLDWPMEGLDKVIIIDQNGKITNIN
ncbi:MAG: S-type pyocin domain-containing protein [Pseudomonadota bacterium]|uniref:CdiA C-terminal domain-containing protein n=1 Tax=Providencia stuartii TaxID=588 RepID=UPI00300D3714